jgi:hypothetical protein
LRDPMSCRHGGDKSIMPTALLPQLREIDKCAQRVRLSGARAD